MAGVGQSGTGDGGGGWQGGFGSGSVNCFSIDRVGPCGSSSSGFFCTCCVGSGGFGPCCFSPGGVSYSGSTCRCGSGPHPEQG